MREIPAPGAPRAFYPALVLCGLLLVVPLVQPRHTLPLTAFYSEWWAYALGAAALYPLLLSRHVRSIEVPAIALLPAAFALLVLVHGLLLRGGYPQLPLLAVAYLVWAAGLMLVARLLRQAFGPVRLVTVLAAFLLGGGLLNALAAVLQQYDLRGPFEALIATQLGAQVYGNLGQSNHFATHMTLALASVAFLHARRALPAIIVLGATALLLFVLTLSGTRASWLHLAALAGLAAVGYRSGRSDELRRTLIFTLLLLPGFAAAHVLAELPWLAPSTAHVTVIDRIVELAGAPSDRLALTQRAWTLFLAQPLTGVGWAQFAWHNFTLAAEPGVPALPGLYNHAHNLVLHLLAETGLAGALLVLGGTACWAWQARGEPARPHGYWVWACALILGLHSMTEYPLWNAHFLGVAALVLGAGETRALALARPRLVRLAALLVIGLTFVAAPLLLERYRTLERVMHSGSGADSRAALARAHEDLMAVHRSFLLAPYVDLAYARAIELHADGIERKLAFQERVMRFMPTGLVAYRYAALLALSGDLAQAEACARRAARTYPGLLVPFLEEFAGASTGNEAAQAQFVAILERLARHEREGSPG